MTEGVFITIKDKAAMKMLVRGCVNGKYLKKFDLRYIADLIDSLEYPLQIPIDIMSVIELSSNKIVKAAFGKQIDDGLTNFIQRLIKAG